MCSLFFSPTVLCKVQVTVITDSTAQTTLFYFYCLCLSQGIIWHFEKYAWEYMIKIHTSHMSVCWIWSYNQLVSLAWGLETGENTKTIFQKYFYCQKVTIWGKLSNFPFDIFTLQFEVLSEALWISPSTQSAKYNLGKYFLNNQNWRLESYWEPCEVSVELGTSANSVSLYWAARQPEGRRTSMWGSTRTENTNACTLKWTHTCLITICMQLSCSHVYSTHCKTQ